MHIDHWLNFATFSEKLYYIYPTPDSYRGLIINGNMAAYASSGLAIFLMEKQIPNYIIDPQTHAFQHDPSAVLNNNNEVKKSILNLSESLGSIFKKHVGKNPITPDLFTADVIDEVVKNSLNFQKNILSTEMVRTEANKFLELTIDDLKPYALLTPYFYLDDVYYERWITPYISLIEKSIEYKNGIKLLVPLVISKGLLCNIDLINPIIKKINSLKIDGYMVWIDNFDEKEATLEELKYLYDLFKILKNNDNEVINRHGGYFSILAAGNLGHNTLSGVAHGPEFGEFRSVVPVGGGLPIAKYYIPKLHQRISYKDAIIYLKKLGYLKSAEIFHKNVCDCPECKRVIDNKIENFTLFGISISKLVKRGHGYVHIEYPTSDTKERCLKHYLQRKKSEYHFSSTKSPEEIISDLDMGINEFQNVIGLKSISHLERWKKTLSS